MVKYMRLKKVKSQTGVLNGKQVGSYTVCVLFKTMDRELVEQYKKIMVLCVTPNNRNTRTLFSQNSKFSGETIKFAELSIL